MASTGRGYRSVWKVEALNFQLQLPLKIAAQTWCRFILFPLDIAHVGYYRCYEQVYIPGYHSRHLRP